MDLAQIESQWMNILSADQQEFVQAYIVTQSVKAASDMVGIPYSVGSRYLASPTIRSAIKLTQKSLREGVHVTPEEVISNLRMMRDMALGRIPIPETKWVDGEPITKYVRQYNANAANKAVENLGRVVGMFTDKKEISVPATDNQLKKRLEDLLGVSLDVTDAEFTEVGESPSEGPTEPHTPGLDDYSLPEELSEALEGVLDDELTTLLAQACDEQEAPK